MNSNPSSSRRPSAALTRALDAKRRWLFDLALPFWFAEGVDWVGGGFHEQFAVDGTLIPDVPRRTRVVSRQIFVFMAAGRLGWDGDWRRAVDHGAQALFTRCLRPHGLVLSTYRPDGTPLTVDFDFYDHAFALFALSELATLPDHNASSLAAAERMIEEMEQRFRHPDAGFIEDVAGAQSLRANPHMHLLEACLGLARAPGASSRWQALADEIVALAAERFIDPESGALREFFDLQWRPMPDYSGRLVEPGHQFEWSWLLHQWNKRHGNARIAAMADRLCTIGEAHGLAIDGATAIDELWDDFTVRTPTARNWPTTERTKACIEQTTRSDDPAAWEARAAEAFEALDRYLATPRPGLWHDRLDAQLSPIAGPSSTSSMYHIVCAIETALGYTEPGDAA
jgi:mannose-6-phosphate isomerase